jgi:hypothetical protein
VTSAPSAPREIAPSSYLDGGPWGRVERVPILLSPPLEFVAYFQQEMEHLDWHFPGHDTARVDELLARLGLEANDRRGLLARAEWNPDKQSLVIPVQPAIVAELPRLARERVYDWLSLHDANVSHANAFRYCGETLADWFRGAPLRDSTIELIQKFAYRRGPFWVFADLPLLAQTISGDELAQALKVLSREATFLMRLHVDERDSVDALAAFWGFGNRNKDIGPLLESLAHIPGGQTIDVVHLLPPFARRLLFTYPRRRQDGLDHRRDCHWTSMNFFRETPDDQFTDLQLVSQVIESRMAKVERPDLRPGDVAVFFASDQEAIHSAVWIADDVLFTKNGPAVTRPWILMQLEDLRNFYTQGRPQTVQYYRWLDLM